MPFKSEKQRKWMWANDPEMAKKWEKEEKMKQETKVRKLIRKMVREIMSEDFAGAYSKEKRAKFDKMRRKQSEVLGYTLTGTNDVKTEIDDATIKEEKTLWQLTEEYITEVSGATRMSEKEWDMIQSKLRPGKKVIILYTSRKGKKVKEFFKVKKVKDSNTIQLGKQKPVKGEFNNYELKWRNNKVWLWAAMGHAKNRTDKGIKDIILR